MYMTLDLVGPNPAIQVKMFAGSESVNFDWHQIDRDPILMKKRKQYHFWIGNG